MRYPTPPDPGTIVGPDAMGEYQVVVETVDGSTTFRPVNNNDLKELATLENPRSPVEIQLIRAARAMATIGLISGN